MATSKQEKQSGVAGFFKGFTRFNFVLASIGGIAIFIAMVITTYEVIARFGFNAPTKWTFDVSNYLLLLSIWLSVAYVTLIDAHIKVTILTERLPVRARAILDAIMLVLGLIYGVALSWVTGSETYRAFVGNWLPESALKFPLYPLYAVICIGSVLFSIAIIERIYHNIRVAKHPGLPMQDSAVHEMPVAMPVPKVDE